MRIGAFKTCYYHQMMLQLPKPVDSCYQNSLTEPSGVQNSLTDTILLKYATSLFSLQLHSTMNAHPQLTSYKREDIPDRYHLKNHYRMPPLYIHVADGWILVQVGVKCIIK